MAWKAGIKDVIMALKSRTGSSLPAIKKALGCDQSQWDYVNEARRSGIADGTFVKSGGRFEVSEEAKNANIFSFSPPTPASEGLAVLHSFGSPEPDLPSGGIFLFGNHDDTGSATVTDARGFLLCPKDIVKSTQSYGLLYRLEEWDANAGRWSAAKMTAYGFSKKLAMMDPVELTLHRRDRVLPSEVPLILSLIHI